MKVIRKEREQYDAFKWEGEFTKELINMLSEYGYGIGSLLCNRLYDGKIVKGVYLVFRGYTDYFIFTEEEFKEQYEVVG